MSATPELPLPGTVIGRERSSSAAATLAERRTIDVSNLPTVVFGMRSLMSWAMVMFMLIEGTSLAICAVSYFYLRRNFTTWPPARTPYPGLLWPTIHVGVLLLSVIPAQWACNAAKRLNDREITRALIVLSLFCVASCVLRYFDFVAINTRWDANAYGSIIWFIVVFHATLLAIDVFDTFMSTAIFVAGKTQDKHYPDVCDNSFYWYFTIASWIVLYLIIYVSPRFI